MLNECEQKKLRELSYADNKLHIKSSQLERVLQEEISLERSYLPLASMDYDRLWMGWIKDYLLADILPTNYHMLPFFYVPDTDPTPPGCTPHCLQDSINSHNSKDEQPDLTFCLS